MEAMETWKQYNIFKVLKGKNWQSRILYVEDLRVMAGTSIMRGRVVCTQAG